MTKPIPPVFNRKLILAGYWAGGVICVLALFSLALGLSPLLSSFKKNITMTSCPGSQTLELKSPGLYTGIGMTKELSREKAGQIADLEYSLLDAEGQAVLPFYKIPPQRFVSDKESGQIPLFQFEIEKKGKYVLDSNYPYNLEGPGIQVVLIHSDLNYTRAELVVGIILFLVFSGLGIYIIRKSYVASRKAQI